MPKQVGVYFPEHRHSDASIALAQADFGTMKVIPGDIVVLFSDGVGDNLAECEIKTILSDALFSESSPQDMAVCLVNKAVLANRKPDDVSAAVGIVQA